MSDLEERIYQLATEALAEQERQVSENRTRGSALLAAGAIIASLLAKPVFRWPHPDGLAQIISAGVGVAGAVALVVFVVLLLRPKEMAFSVNAMEAYRALWDRDIVEQPLVDLALAEAFEQQREQNAVAIEALVRWLGLALLALVVEVAGLGAAAALAS